MKKEEEKKKSRVLSLKISDLDLASCMEFEEILTGFSSSSFTTGINLLLSSVLNELRKRKKLSFLDEKEATFKIENILERKGKTSIGREKVLKKGEERAENLFLFQERKRPDLSLSAFSPSLLEKEKGEEKEIEKRNEKEIENEFNSIIDNSVEEIIAEEELDLLSKILFKSEK